MFKCRPVGIASIGAYTPEKRLTNSDLEKIVDTSDEWITTRTGIKERRIAPEGIASSDLAVEAAKKAIERAGIDPDSIQMVVASTATPDMLFPPTACFVQQKLGLKNVAAFDLEAGCTGFMYAISVASRFVETGDADTVLVVCAEVLSRILNWEDRNTCVLFGDGAGAVILRPASKDRGIVDFHLSADGNYTQALELPAGGSLNPATEETVQKKLHYVHMDGREVFRQAVTRMSESALKIIERSGISVSDIDHYIPHQANIRIIESVSKRLGIPTEKVITNLQYYGNTSSASIPIAINEAYEAGNIKDGDLMLLTAVGAGLTWGSMLLRWGI